MSQPNPNASPEGTGRRDAYPPGPPTDIADAEPSKQPGNSNPAIVEHLDPREIRSAAPADGTGATGTVRPA